METFEKTQVVLAASKLDYISTPNVWCQIWPNAAYKKMNIYESFKA